MRYRLRPTLDACHLRNRVKCLGPRPAPGGDGGAFPAACSDGRAPAGRGRRARDCAYPQRSVFDMTGARWGLDGAEALLKLFCLEPRRLGCVRNLSPGARATSGAL